MPQWGSYTLGSFSGFDLELWFSLGLENTLCFVHSTIVDRCPRTEASNRRLWGKHHTWCYLGTKHCFWGVHRPCVLVHYAEILTDACPLLGETRQVLALKKLRETYLSLMSNNGCNNPRRVQANKQTRTSGAEEITMCFINDIPFCWTVFSNTQGQHGPMETERLPEPDRPEFKSFLCYHSGFLSLTVGIFRPITELSQIQSTKMTQWKRNELNLTSPLSEENLWKTKFYYDRVNWRS